MSYNPNAATLTKRVVALTDAATITPNANTTDVGTVAELSQATQFITPTGTPYDGQTMMIRMKSTVARAVTWDAGYVSGSAVLPSTTSVGVITYTGLIYYSSTTKWHCLAAGTI